MTATIIKANVSDLANGRIPGHLAWLPELIPGEYSMVDRYLVGVATVQPEAAQAVLEHHNNDNRQRIDSNINRLAKSMTKGLWKLNGEPIVFDTTKNMRQGQHRMASCVLSNTPFRTFIIAGAPLDAFVTYDQHSKRSLAQLLYATGEQYPAVLSSGITYLIQFLYNGEIRRAVSSSLNITREDELSTLGQHDGLRASSVVVNNMGSKSAKMFGGQGVVCCLHYIFSRVNKDLASQLFHSLHTFSVLPGDAWLGTRLLLKKLVDNQSQPSDARLNAESIAALTVKAWNALREQKRILKLVYLVDEEFPRVNGWLYRDGKPVSPESGF